MKIKGINGIDMQQASEIKGGIMFAAGNGSREQAVTLCFTGSGSTTPTTRVNPFLFNINLG